MYCPLFTAASIAKTGEGDEITDQCEEAKCAWWDRKNHRCRVTSVSTDLSHIRAELEAVVNKMPSHERLC